MRTKSIAKNTETALEKVGKYALPIVLVIAVFFILKSQFLQLFHWVKTKLSPPKEPTETPQGSTLTNEQIQVVKASLVDAFNYHLGEDEDIMNLLQPLNAQDLIRVKNAFGLWYRDPLDGKIRQGFLAGLFLSSKNFYQLLKAELSESNYSIVKNQFNTVLV